MKEELYEDVMDEEPDMHAPEKEHKKHTKRLRKSIGWCYPEQVIWNRKDSNISNVEIEYSVYCGDGCSMDFKDQGLAAIYTEVIQINQRLKRMEDAKQR